MIALSTKTNVLYRSLSLLRSGTAARMQHLVPNHIVLLLICFVCHRKSKMHLNLESQEGIPA